ncbi:MAG TPA: PLD nuclease N-terminal domain-containing protein [Pseudomonadales bacterium]|nr:PLD nuclease N-terminal domain-containing protein [Pseudomonadales bacterium]
MEVSGFFGLLVLIADIYAVIQIFQSPASPLAKALWIAAVVVLPVLGLIIWFFFGPKAARV